MGFVQLELLFPIGVGTGFVIVCLELAGLLRFSQWILWDDRKSLKNELDNRPPAMINVRYIHHILAFLVFPFAVLIVSIVLNLILILTVHSELSDAFNRAGTFYKITVSVLYALALGYGSYLTFIVLKEYRKLNREYRKLEGMPITIPETEKNGYG